MDFPQDYNCPEVEAKWKQYWADQEIYKFNPAHPGEIYSVDTPPPYVSADHLHAGHLMSYAQAEFIVRYKRQRGFNVYYPMGFDDNGLPTERYVEKKYNIDKSHTTKAEFITKCLEETARGSKTYRDLWTDLGISVDWSKTYSTINPTATRVSQWSVIDLYKKGALYRSESPVLFCPTCQTALSQADLEDQEENLQLNYLYFKSPAGENLTIATSRPELLAACVALYVNPEDARYQKLIGRTAQVPLFNYEVPIKSSDQVDPAFGTGLMMVCSWGDSEDLAKWQTDKLETRALFTPEGRLNHFGQKYEGMKIKAAREAVITDLKDAGLLAKQEPIVHSLNVHERCSTPAEFILSKQWFIKISNMAETWLEYGQKLNWYPQTRWQDYATWVNSIKWDWCISRQRFYGVPFPIWYCATCDEPVFASEEQLPVNPEESKPPVDSCPKCQGQEFVPDRDVMDTWATSSCTPFLIRELVDDQNAYQKLYPATLRPNAHDIIRTWDFYSVVKSYYNFNSIPFRDVMISGHGLDEKGKKISKRLGNYIPAGELVAKFGADPTRYWATGASLGSNLRFNPGEIQKGKRTYIKLWNVARLLSLHLDKPYLSAKLDNLEPTDQWIIDEFNQALSSYVNAFDQYEFATARDHLDTFFWSALADYYIEFIKHRLFGDNPVSKQSALDTLVTIYNGVLKMYAPIMPFITEEIFSLLYADLEKVKSIHISSWPAAITPESPVDVTGFAQAIAAINDIRKHKSENNQPLNHILADFKLSGELDQAKYGEFVKQVMKVEKLT